MYKWQQVKALRAQGKSIKKISRMLDLSKNTVRKYLRSSRPPVFKVPEHEKMLDGYQDKIKEMLTAGYIGTRIHKELLKSGYEGSLSTVHRYISGVKEEEKIAKLVTTRVETAPGKQMQYDWKEWNLPVGEESVKVYIHALVLGYSRKKYYTFSLGITGQDVMRAIVSGMEFFGGLAEQLVMDNAKQMIITHKNNGIVRYNDEFLRFCGLYGIDPSPCRKYRARTKGKVERPFYYLQEHLLRGLQVKEIGEFEGLLTEFTDLYNAREHSDLKESPNQRFEVERRELKTLPEVEPTVLFSWEIRKVSNDGYVSWEGDFYPVPMRLCLGEVMCESVLGRRLLVYGAGGEMVSEHPISPVPSGIRPLHPEHEEINLNYQKKREESRQAVLERFSSLFGSCGREYISGLSLAAGPNLCWHLSEVLACNDIYDNQEICRALKECIAMGSYHKNSVLRLLDPLKLKRPSPGDGFPDTAWAAQTIARPLSAYADLEENCHE